MIDDQIYDQMIEEFLRMGSRLLTEEQTGALAAKSFTEDGRVEFQVLGQSCVNLGKVAGFEASETDKVLLAPLPTDLDALAEHPFIAEKLMPVLGVVRSPSIEHGSGRARWSPSTPALGTRSAVYARDEDVIRRFSLAVRTGRILVDAADGRRWRSGARLQLDDPDLLARLRHLGGLDHDRRASTTETS